MITIQYQLKKSITDFIKHEIPVITTGFSDYVKRVSISRLSIRNTNLCCFGFVTAIILKVSYLKSSHAVHFTNSIRAHNSNLKRVSLRAKTMNKSIIHVSRQKMTCREMLPGWSIIMKITTKRMCKSYQRWAHQQIVKRVPVFPSNGWNNG